MNKISCYTIPDTANRITVEVANIFDQKGTKIIHCPRTFETHPDVVKQESLIGQFIAMCQHNEVELDTQIDKWCTKIAVKGKTDNKLEHRNVVFPCGEVCPIMSAHMNFSVGAPQHDHRIISYFQKPFSHPNILQTL